MASSTEFGGVRPGGRRRIMIWAIATALILMIPFVAMRMTAEVDWTGFDFIFAGGLIFGTGLAFELATRASANLAYRMGVGVALVACFLLIWVNGAVGIIGSENNPLNLVYLAFIAAGIVGAALVRLRAGGMARVIGFVTMLQALFSLTTLVAGWGANEPPGPIGIFALNGFFTLLLFSSAWLFRQAELKTGLAD